MPVLLIAASKRQEDLVFCQNVAARSNFDFVGVSETQKLDTLLIDRPQSLVFWDIDDTDSMNPKNPLSIPKLLPILTKHLKPRHIFGLASQSVFELPEMHRANSVGHYLVRHYSPFAETWISRLCIPLFSQEPFGLDYYKDDDAVAQTIELKGAREKGVAIEAMGNLLLRRKMNDRAVQMILRVIDELLMNAIFDAPINEKGVRYRRETARDGAFALKGKERVFLNLAFNKEFVNISVKDQFGSFVSNQAFNAVQRDYSVYSYKADEKTKSAGLGLHGIAASGIGAMISCRPDVATEAVIAFPYYKTFKETKEAFRSFSFNIRG